MLRGSHDLLFFLIYDLLPAERKAALGELASLLAVDALQHTTAAGFPLEQVAVAHERRVTPWATSSFAYAARARHIDSGSAVASKAATELGAGFRA